MNFNYIFLTIFIIEIIFGIIGIIKLPINVEILIVMVVIIFISGIYAVSILFFKFISLRIFFFF